MAFFSLEPFPEPRADLRMAILASTIANTTPGIKRRYKASHFLPDYEKAARLKFGTGPDPDQWKRDLASMKAISSQINTRLRQEAYLEPKK